MLDELVTYNINRGACCVSLAPMFVLVVCGIVGYDGVCRAMDLTTPSSNDRVFGADISGSEVSASLPKLVSRLAHNHINMRLQAGLLNFKRHPLTGLTRGGQTRCA